LRPSAPTSMGRCRTPRAPASRPPARCTQRNDGTSARRSRVPRENRRGGARRARGAPKRGRARDRRRAPVRPAHRRRAQAELMTEALAESRSGSVSSRSAATALALLSTRDALALGPGLGVRAARAPRCGAF
jgi:hypothetical protein